MLGVGRLRSGGGKVTKMANGCLTSVAFYGIETIGTARYKLEGLRRKAILASDKHRSGRCLTAALALAPSLIDPAVRCPRARALGPGATPPRGRGAPG
eukprot:8129822-Alexandrium_andersonii.AAC.1